MRTPNAAVLTAALSVFCIARGDAAAPTFWRVSTQAEFLKGQVDNLSIDSDGRVILGPAGEVIHESTAPFLWTLARDTDGQIWAGSGNEGKVFRVDNDGQISTFFETDELEAHALVTGPDGVLYVGTSPDGRIYKVDASGTAVPLFDPEEKYIWALLAAPDEALYAATGDSGAIYRIAPDGTGELFYRTKSTHVLTLASDREGEILAGTESPGQILRIDRTGRAFVLLDSPYREIRALVTAPDGTIYAAAVSGTRPPEASQPERPAGEVPRQVPVPSVSTEITAISIGQVPVGATAQPASTRRQEQGRASTGAVYRIAPDGLWDVIWKSTEDLPYALSLDGAGSLIVGTGRQGKIFRISTAEPSRVLLATRADAQQVTSFLRDGEGRFYYATANPGRIVRLSSSHTERGSYESEVRDASGPATWGRIRWRTEVPRGAVVEVSTRSGNTATPDETWSLWSEPYQDADGEQVNSPKARYLQWRAILTANDRTPVLTSVTIAYLPRNVRPEVASITVHPPGTVFQKPFSTGEFEIAGFDDREADGRPAPSEAAAPASAASPAPILGRRAYEKGLQTLVWTAEDDNGDRLQFDILYRREAETIWKVLRRGLWDSIFVWDTTSVPDGSYTVKIVATDAPENAPGNELAGSLESTAFDIDNTPPQIDVASGQVERGVMAFSVHDVQSAIQRAEYSLDANRWRPVYPTDGIHDSRNEDFEIVLDEEDVGSVIIRATDALNNTATAVAESPTKP